MVRIGRKCAVWTTELMATYAKRYNMVIIVPIYEKEQAGVLYNTAAVIDANGPNSESTEKITFRIPPDFGENFSLSPEILVIRCFKLNMQRLVYTLLRPSLSSFYGARGPG